MWAILLNALTKEGVSPVKLIKIKQEWEQFDIDRLDPLKRSSGTKKTGEKRGRRHYRRK